MTVVCSRAFWLPKVGNTDADYEDAYAVGEGCVAIADGATESSYARLWAQLLVDGFTRPPHAPISRSLKRFQQWLQPLQSDWHRSVPWDRLPWFAEDKARAGAFSSLLAFEFRPPPATETAGVETEPEERRWQALAIGDSCLFQVRNDDLRVAYPLEQAEQFNSRPALLCSNPAGNARVWDELTLIQGDYRPGDILLFATDALARWFLAQYEAGDKPWQTLCSLRDHNSFLDLIAELRAEHVLRNDDVTLVILQEAEGETETQWSVVSDQWSEEAGKRAEEDSAEQSEIETGEQATEESSEAELSTIDNRQLENDSDPAVQSEIEEGV